MKLTFPSIADAARYFDISANVVLNRFDSGYSEKQAVGILPLDWISPDWHPITIDGKTFKTIKDADLIFVDFAFLVRNDNAIFSCL